MATEATPTHPPVDDLDSTARLPTLVETGLDDELYDTGTWNPDDSPFAEHSGARLGELQASVAAGEATIAQLHARLEESEAWAAQLAQEVERLRPAANVEAELAAAVELAGRHAAERDALQIELERLRAEHGEARPVATAAPSPPLPVPLPPPPPEPGLRAENRKLALRVETLLERLRSMEALRRYAADFRHADAVAAAGAASAASREQLAGLEQALLRAESRARAAEARANEADAALAGAESASAAAEAALASATAQRQAADEAAAVRERELQDKAAALEESVVAAALEIQALRDNAARPAAAPAAVPVPAAAADDLSTGEYPADEPTLVVDDEGTLARRYALACAELDLRSQRIRVLEGELAVQAEALQAIRRGLSLLPAAEAAPADATPAVVRYLQRLDDGSRRLHALRGPRCTIGRTPDCDVEVPESFVSRVHAVIRLAADKAIVEDAGSTNGVYVNEQRVRRHLLADGDVVAFGRARYRYTLARPPD